MDTAINFYTLFWFISLIIITIFIKHEYNNEDWSTAFMYGLIGGAFWPVIMPLVMLHLIFNNYRK